MPVASIGQRLIDLLEAWELLTPEASVDRYSLREWKVIADEIEQRCATFGTPAPGSVHVGLTQGILVSEGRETLSSIAPYLLLYDNLWLPNAAFSALTATADEGWSWCPDAKNDYFATKGIHTRWRNFWGVPVDARKHFLRNSFSQTLAVQRELVPLIADGIIRLAPWETLLTSPDGRTNLKSVVDRASSDDALIKLSQSISQSEFALGPRVGGIGIEVSPNQPAGSDLRPGQQMFLVDKRPMVLSGALNALVSEVCAASLASPRRGDRLIHDYLVSGAQPPVESRLAAHIVVPKFSAALWPDIVAIRRNSEALANLRSVLRDASGLDEERALPIIRERLEEAAARLREESSIKRAVKDHVVDLAVATLVTGTTAAVAASAAPGAAAFWAVISGLGGLTPIARSIASEGRWARAKAGEIIVRVSDRLS